MKFTNDERTGGCKRAFRGEDDGDDESMESVKIEREETDRKGEREKERMRYSRSRRNNRSAKTNSGSRLAGCWKTRSRPVRRPGTLNLPFTGVTDVEKPEASLSSVKNTLLNAYISRNVRFPSRSRFLVKRFRYGCVALTVDFAL